MLAGLAATLALGVLLWQLPRLVSGWSRAPGEAPPPTEAELALVDSFLAGALERAGADEVLAHQETDGVVQSIRRLPPGADAVATARRIREQAAEQGIELYLHSPDALDAELRVYAGRDLRARVLLVPDITAPPDPPRTDTLRERPLLAFVVTGLGEEDATRLLETKVPLSLGLRPYAPFSLRIAREALRRWHEVLAHLPEGGDAEALAAVPWASGMVVDGGPSPELPTLPFGVLVHAAAAPGRRPPSALTPLPAQRPARLGALETLNRARALATREGSAAMMLDASDPQLDAVLAWARAASTAGFRVALASEVARADEVRGVHPSEG